MWCENFILKSLQGPHIVRHIDVDTFFDGMCLLGMYTPGRRQSKTSILSTNVYQKSLETEFLIAICHQSGDKWQSKTLFLAIFDPRSSTVKSVFDCRLPGVM